MGDKDDNWDLLRKFSNFLSPRAVLERVKNVVSDEFTFPVL